MASLKNIKNNTMGSIAALQTVLERYPVLVTTDRDTGKTTFSFMLNLLKMFNVSDEDILTWMSGLLTDEKDGAKCLLWTIEEAVKLAILASFEETYTCSINPLLPNDIMYDIYNGYPRGNGLEIKLRDIDAFGLLSNTPTNENGRMFYFDNIDYSPSNIYSSMDFNAYLWYVINKGTAWVEGEKRKNMWDNRTLYYLKFKNEGCLNGDSATDESTSKGRFFSEKCEGQPVRVTDIGPKKEILYCEYEDQNRGISPVLRVWLNSNRYYGTNVPQDDIMVAKNKTIFEFNADYLNSLKLFDSKTLVAQIINAILGITASLGTNGTVEREIIAKSMEKLVTKVIEEDDNETVESNDCYYSFSNEEYDKMLQDAQLKLEGKFQSRNEANDLISINTARIAEGINLIDGDAEDKTEAIANALKEAALAVADTPQTDNGNRWSFGWNIINEFIKEAIVQIALQVLSPKIMLLFEINDSLMNPDKKDRSIGGAVDFFKRFPNLMVSIIRKIKDIVAQELYDYLMGLLRPLLTLFVQKLLLETIYYYKILLEQLIAVCSGGGNGLLTIDNVIGADIIPDRALPSSNDGCRNT